MVEGYNIALKLNGKTVLGRTQEDLSISAVTKESITKDDMGLMQRSVVRHDVSFSVSALLKVGDEGSEKLDRDAVIAMALAVGSDAIIPVVYSCKGGDTYGGNAIITGYSESSSADSDSDTSLSLDLQITGDFTKQA